MHHHADRSVDMVFRKITAHPFFLNRGDRSLQRSHCRRVEIESPWTGFLVQAVQPEVSSQAAVRSGNSKYHLAAARLCPDAPILRGPPPAARPEHLPGLHLWPNSRLRIAPRRIEPPKLSKCCASGRNVALTQHLA